MTLRWLAAGNYLDIALWRHVLVSTFKSIVDETAAAVDSIRRQTEFPFENEVLLQRAGVRFTRGHRSPLKGCVGALDSIAIKILEPRKGSVANPSTYYNRKGFSALCMQC
jgi:hypothetical protein